jgi:hypothetical protein
MPRPTSESYAGQVLSSQDLPYGPLPVRGEPTTAPSGRQPLDQLVELSWLALADGSPPEATANGPDRVRGEAAGPEESADDTGAIQPPRGHAAGQDEPDEDLAADDGDGVGGKGGDDVADPAAGLSLTSPRPEADDDVHFGVAATALGVSRKTIERMVKRGELERGPSNAPATVSKRALVSALEARRRNVSHLTRATEIERSKSADAYPAAAAPPAAAAASALTELAPVLAPLLDEFVEARTRAAVLENELERLRARAGQDRARDELLLALATTGWRGRRKTREAVLRHYVLGERPDSGPPSD